MSTSDLITTNLLGLVVGIVASFLTWWVLFHWFTPEVKFSPFISKIVRKGGSGYSYRIKLMNTGRRPILGVEVYARLWILWNGSGNWVGIYIPFSGEGEKKYDIPILKRDGNRVLSFFLNAVESFKTNIAYPEDLRAKAINRVVTMEDILSLGSQAYVQVFVSGFDSFSGARRVFESRKLKLEDIYFRRFAKDGLGLGIASSIELVDTDKPTAATRSEA